jgi:predicted P-loop ATPase
MSALHDAALDYAARGWAVFPLKERDKVPAVAGGFKVATTDEDEIDGAWEHRPALNVGIATGSMSGGLIVIDLDVHEERGEDGADALWEWEREHGELPETVSAKTGSGGVHLYYQANTPISSSVNTALGVDVRAEGGYVVAPPSVHPSGQPYAWDNSPEDFGVAPADERVLEFVKFVQGGDLKRKVKFKLPKEIKEGCRNTTLHKYGSSMQSRGFSDAEIYAGLVGANITACKPPLPQEDVDKIYQSVLGYEKGNGVPQEEADFIRDKYDQIIQRTFNCVMAIRKDESLSGRFGYDESAYTKTLRCPLPWDRSDCVREVRDSDYINLHCYLERKWGLTKKQNAIDALVSECERNRYDPVRSWLEGLEWDGTPRMDMLLPAALGADPNDYNVAVTRAFMFGAIARAMEPGVKFDYVMVLKGDQGLGKSTFLKNMSPSDRWYLENLDTVEGDAAVEKIRGKWIVEMAELMATKSMRGVESIKAFVTTRNDTIRPKYGRETEQRPRRCVIVGTTNSGHFLTDRTGNRRFLPVECGVYPPAIDVFDEASMREYAAQAWAEAMERYRSGDYSLTMPRDLEPEIERVREAYNEDDPRVGIIQRYLDTKQANTTNAVLLRVCAHELVADCLADEIGGLRETPAVVREVHEIMSNLIVGWERAERRGKTAYGVQTYYFPTGSVEDAEARLFGS